MGSGKTYTTERWVLVRGDEIHTFSIDEECNTSMLVYVDGKKYLRKAGRNFWDECIRIGYVLDEELSNKCKMWDTKEFHDMCRVKES